MESKERTAQCLLGHGDCPLVCNLFMQSGKITTRFGDKFDPEESRRRIIAAESSNGKSVTELSARIIANCLKEGRIIEGK